MSDISTPRYLTKSKFKLALECPTKLFYADRRNGYFDRNSDNDFLQSLADGGHQIGELAKYKYHSDPVGAGITVETLDYDAAVLETTKKLDCDDSAVVAEAALLVPPYFVRVDILIRDKTSKTIELIEVKSKSITKKMEQARFSNDSGKYDSKWLPYLYDIAFQAEVARLAFPGYRIVPKLLLVDSSMRCDLDGLHQMFPIITKRDPDSGRTRAQVRSPAGTTARSLGSLNFLKEVDVSDIVADLRLASVNNPAHIPSPFSESMLTFMQWAAVVQQQGARFFHGVSKNCRACQFKADIGEAQLSGVHECWRLAMQQGILHGAHRIDRSVPLSIDLWGGGAGSKSIADAVLSKGRAFLADIQEDDIKPKAPPKDPACQHWSVEWPKFRLHPKPGQPSCSMSIGSQRWIPGSGHCT